jgi:hypothetical protein
MFAKMRKLPALRAVCGAAALSALLFFTGCPSSDPGGGFTRLAEETYPGTVSGLTKTTVNGNDIKTLLYVEVNDHSPLNAGDYVLVNDDRTDTKYFFDYVVLFAANVRDRNCALETGDDHGCTESGVHLHFNRQTRYVLNNASTLIAPLQAKGIKVLLGLLGDHDGIGFASMNLSEISTFVADVAAAVSTYNLDGVDFDDEWANRENWLAGDGITNVSKVNTNATTGTKLVYPTMDYWWPFPDAPFAAKRDPAKGIVPNNYSPSATGAQLETMWKAGGDPYYNLLTAMRAALPTGKIITVYEYNFGKYIVNNSNSVTGTMLASKVDYTLNPMYNQFIAASLNTGMPNLQYAPLAADLSGKAYSSQKGTPNPPFVDASGSAAGTGTIADYAGRFLAQTGGNAYGMVFFYNLRATSGGDIKYAQDGLSEDNFADDANRRYQSEYLTALSQDLFGKDVLVVDGGGNHLAGW